MIGREARVLLRHYLEQGMSKAAIARQVGVSRRTVYRWIASGQLDRELDDEAVRYGPRSSRPSKLDPYKGIIETRLAEYPDLSAVRLFQEVQAAGYAGGYDQVKRYVRTARPRPAEAPVQREVVRTPPVRRCGVAIGREGGAMRRVEAKGTAGPPVNPQVMLSAYLQLPSHGRRYGTAIGARAVDWIESEVAVDPGADRWRTGAMRSEGIRGIGSRLARSYVSQARHELAQEG